MTNSTDASPMSNSPLFETGSRLSGRVLPVGALSATETGAMFALLDAYFSGASRERFAADLAEKESVILLTDPAGILRGFSTLMRFAGEVDGVPYVAFFSGDTIIEPDFWGDTVLPRLWARTVFSLAAAVRDRRVWWLLISSGYKTYRFLPVFFRNFYPAVDRPLPAELRTLRDAVAGRKFPDEYDPASGVVRLRYPAPLRPGVAELTVGRLRDPHVAFFAAVNPGWRDGDELACLTEIDRANLTAAGRRMLGEGR